MAKQRNCNRCIRLILARCLLLASTSYFQTPANANSAEAQLEYAAGIMDYQKGQYRTAAAHFQASVEKAPDVPSHALRRLYLAHCYAALKETDKAKSLYQEVVNNAFGSAEAKFAEQCIAKLQAKSPANTTAKQPTVARSLVNRIEVVEPKSGHPPVSTQYIAMIKSTVAALPNGLYTLLDKGGCSITVAPNIVDKWPDAGNESLPEHQEIKLSEYLGRTYGSDIHMWERPLRMGGKNELGRQFPISLCKSFFLMQLAYAACAIANVTDDKELAEAYKSDVAALASSERNKATHEYISKRKLEVREVAASAITNHLHREENRDIDQLFPKSYRWIQKRFSL